MDTLKDLAAALHELAKDDAQRVGQPAPPPDVAAAMAHYDRLWEGYGDPDTCARLRAEYHADLVSDHARWEQECMRRARRWA